MADVKRESPMQGGSQRAPDDGEMREPTSSVGDVSGEAGSVREQAEAASRDVSARARSLMEEGRGEAQSLMEDGKDEIARRMQGIARALRTTADNLREQDESLLAQYAEVASRKAANASGFLRDHRALDLLRELEDAARRQPVLALGGALIAGAAAGRFLHPPPGMQVEGPGEVAPREAPEAAPPPPPSPPLGGAAGFPQETVGETPGGSGDDREGSPSKS